MLFYIATYFILIINLEEQCKKVFKDFVPRRLETAFSANRSIRYPKSAWHGVHKIK